MFPWHLGAESLLEFDKLSISPSNMVLFTVTTDPNNEFLSQMSALNQQTKAVLRESSLPRASGIGLSS